MIVADTIGLVKYAIALTRRTITRVQSLNDSKGFLADSHDTVAAELKSVESTLRYIHQKLTLQPQHIQIVGVRIDIVQQCLWDMKNFHDNVHKHKEGRCRRGLRGWLHKRWWLKQVTGIKKKLAAYQDEFNLQLEVLSVPSSLFRK